MQTKTQSFIEQSVSILLGFVLALVTQVVVFKLYGIQAEAHEQVSITLIFTVVSFIRGYYVRRAFNWLHHGGYEKIKEAMTK